MEQTSNEPASNPMFSEAAFAEAKDRTRIEGFRAKFFKSYGEDMTEWYDGYFAPKIKGKKLTIEEYSKLVNEDEYFKLISTLNHHRKTKIIHFWILFWSIVSILSIIAGVIIYFAFIRETSYYHF